MKRNSPRCPTVAMCLVGAASTMAGFSASAFQLGQIQSTSRLGEPLAAHINVMMSPRESLLETTLSVLPDFDYRNDPVMKDALNTISAKIVRSEYGHHYIALSSTKELNLPLLSFRLKATNGENILIQAYSLAPSPVVRANPKVSTGRRRAPVPAQASTQLTDSSAPSLSGDEYGPVKAGDTLWKIAARVVGREQAGTILNQLFELNPHAFINGDMNKLKQGVTLTLPSDASSQQIAVEETVVADQPSDIRGMPDEFESGEPVAAVSDSAPSTNDSTIIEGNPFDDAVIAAEMTPDSDIGELVEPALIASASTNTTPIDWRAENPELSEKLTKLSDKYAALRARYATQSDAVTGGVPVAEEILASDTADSSLDISTDTGYEGTEPAVATQEILDNEAAILDSNVASLAAPTTQSSAGVSRFELPSWLLLLLGMTLAVSAVGFFLYRARATSTRKTEQLLRKEKDSSLKQELAKKAQHRIMMEGEVERMLHERIDDDGDEIEKTMQLHVNELIPKPIEEISMSAEDSAESKIDASISHGRYAEAEELLSEVIAGSPRNFAAKLRLAEVYYITEKISDFVNISQDIHAHHRPDISDEDWRRVMRMGKMIAPEQAPFSGPQSIMDDASAG